MVASEGMTLLAITQKRPSPPGKPYLVADTHQKFTDVITITWSPPLNDGGAPINGYIVEHRRTGSPHWLRATPHLVLDTELPLTGLEPGWRYQFRVSAENEVGRSDPGDLSEPLTVTPQRTAASAPFFNIELQDKIGLENEKVEFKVHVIGVPVPTISWYKDGFEIFSSRRTKIVTEDDRSMFIIHQAALQDEGEIKCTATNRAGHAVTKATLKLQAPPRIRLPRQYEDGLIFEKGEPIRLKVTAAGRPKPEVYWYHNGEVLEKGGRIDIVHSETGSVLKINDACRSDRGEYAIVGVNKIGEDTASILVTVTDRPSPPGNIQIVLDGRNVTLSWSSSDDDGGCKIGTYIIEYFRVGWDMWLKAKSSRQLTATLENLIEGSEYKFRIRAENPYGISDPSVETQLIFIPDPRRGVTKPSPTTDVFQIFETVTVTEAEADESEGSKKRRLLEEKARKLLDTPLSELLPYNSSGQEKRKAADSSAESISIFAGDENLPPSVPRRKNKGKKRLNLNSSNSDFDDRQSQTSSADESFTKGTLKPVASRESDKFVEPESNDRKIESDKSQKDWIPFKKDDSFNIESPLYPRENDDSIIHGSSELMLVLYPRDRSKSVELSAQQRLKIEESLREEGVAPPMSLSSPELSMTETFELPPLRNAVSSTELLYEKTTARLYQDSIEEEEAAAAAQKVVKRRYSADRKSMEKRSSLIESILERRQSFKENESKEDGSKETENLNEIKVQLTIPKPNFKTERLNSVEKEQIEFAKVRERLRKKEEEKQALMLSLNQLSDTTATTTPTSSSYDIYETEEEITEYEDEYLDREDYAGERKVSEDDGFDMNNAIQAKQSGLSGEILHKPRRGDIVEEEDTYHPRSMVPTRSIIKQLEKPGEQGQKSSPSPTRSPVPSVESDKPDTPPNVSTSKKLKKTSKILKKFSLKKHKKVPEVTLTPPDSNLKPILKNKTVPPPEKSPIISLRLRRSKPSISEEESETEFVGKKKKVRIAEPKLEDESEEKSADDSAAENQVLIYHYNDILKEYGGPRRGPSRLLSNHSTLKSRTTKPDESPSKAVPTAKDSSPALKEDQKPPVQPVQEEVKETATDSTTPPVLPKPSHMKSTSLEYTTDVAMFLVACWFYFFKNELYAIPILCIMAYRQMKDMAVERYNKLKKLVSNQVPENSTGKSQTDEKPKK